MRRDRSAVPVLGQPDVDPASMVLGLPGFVVLAAGEYGGELEARSGLARSGRGLSAPRRSERGRC